MCSCCWRKPKFKCRHTRIVLHTTSHQSGHFLWQGYVDVVKVLLEDGAKVDVQDVRLLTPTHLAVRNGHPEVVKALLLAGCNLNKKDHHGRNVWNEARQVNVAYCTYYFQPAPFSHFLPRLTPLRAGIKTLQKKHIFPYR